MNDFDNDTLDDLSGFFTAAQRDVQNVPAGLMDRMLADAASVQEGFMPSVTVRPAAPGLLRGLRDMLGGWPAMAGLMAACATGIWLGFSPPSALPDPFEIAGLLQDDLDMFDADSVAVGWFEN